MRFLVDMPLPPALAAWLREQGHEPLHAGELSLDRAPDSNIIDLARKEIEPVTADLDYPRLIALSGNVGPSLILFRNGDWSDADVITRMSELLQALSATEIVESIIVVARADTAEEIASHQVKTAERLADCKPHSHARLSTVFSYVAPGTVMFHFTVQS